MRCFSRFKIKMRKNFLKIVRRINLSFKTPEIAFKFNHFLRCFNLQCDSTSYYSLFRKYKITVNVLDILRSKSFLAYLQIYWFKFIFFSFQKRNSFVPSNIFIHNFLKKGLKQVIGFRTPGRNDVPSAFPTAACVKELKLKCNKQNENSWN